MRLVILLAVVAACSAQTVITPNPGDPIHIPPGSGLPSGSVITGPNLALPGALSVVTTVCDGSRIVVTCPPYNAVGDGTTNNYAAIVAAQAAATSAGKPVYFPPGTYAHGTALTITDAGTRWYGEPDKSILKYTGGSTANGVYFNGTHVMRMEASGLSFDGGAATTAFRIKQLTNFKFDRIRILGATTNGMVCEWCVAGEIDRLGISANLASFTVTPVVGLRFEAATSDIKVSNPYIQGVSGAGILITGGSQNLSFTGGSSEGNAYGIDSDSTTTHNAVYSMDLEGNTSIDIREAGTYNTYYTQAFSTSSVSLISPAKANNFYGGYFTGITIASGANLNTWFGGIVGAAPSDSGTGNEFHRVYNVATSDFLGRVEGGASYVITKAGGNWTINGGSSVAADAAVTQVITWYTAPAGAALSSVRLKTLVACSGATNILVDALGANTATEFYSGGYNLKAGVNAGNVLWLPLLNPGHVAAASAWTATVDAFPSNISAIADGCSFEILAQWSVKP